MKRIRKLIDILEASKDELFEDFNNYIRAILFHGSFSYQNLDSFVINFDNLYGENGILDKKPDFVVIVSDLEAAIRKIGQRRNWNEEDIKKILNLRNDTPFHFNLKTISKYRLDLRTKSENVSLQYKIGIIAEDAFLKLHEIKNHNIYLPSRLSKFFNIVYQDKDIKPVIKETVEIIRNYFIDLTLKTLPREFSGEEFARKYLFVTYIAEAYRIFDLIKSRHISILESKVYDYEAKKLTSMRNKLENILYKKLKKRDIELVQRDSFYNSTFIKEDKLNRIKNFYDFLLFNIVSASIVFNKDRITNKIGGASNLSYVARKFR